METKANNLVVGVFVLLTLVVGVIFIIWLSRVGAGGPKKEYFVVFSGSVQGLAKGSYVLFNGLRVGEVEEIGINPGNTSEIRALINMDKLTPVKRNSTVRLTYTGLTGVASIEISGGNPQSEDLIPGPDRVPPTLYSERSFVQNLLESGTETLNNVNEVVAKVNKFVDENSGPLTDTIRDMKRTAHNLAEMSDQAEAEHLVENINATAKTIRQTAESLDKRITIISSDVSRFTDKGLKELEGLISDGRRTLSSFDEAVREIGRNPQQVIFGRPSIPTYKGH